MIKKTDISVTEFAIFLQLLPEQTRNYILNLEQDEFLKSIDLLPESIAPTGRILKFTLYDYLGKDDPSKDDRTDRSGTCISYLFSLDEGATIRLHEHSDNHKPTDAIEIYKAETPNITDHLGKPLSTTPCLFGEQHGIGKMPIHSLIYSQKADRNNTTKIDVNSPYPVQKQNTNTELDR